MVLTKRLKLMLFALGEYYKIANQKVKVDSLHVVIPKTDFIRLIQKTQIAEKKSRAIYKNLATLEKKKMISYHNKGLMFTGKGIKILSRIEEEIQPYQHVLEVMQHKKVVSLTKKPQTVFFQKTLT